MENIIAVSNQKGGVGKTLVSYNLAACLSLDHGKKVLLIDNDPQANLSEYLGYVPDGKPTLTDLIMDAVAGNSVNDKKFQSAVRHNDATNVDYIPSNINLANAETLMLTALSKETVLRRILSDEHIGGYDYIIIDCLPSLGTLLINALTAADKVLMPVQTQKFSLDGLHTLMGLCSQVKAAINPKLEILGILPTMVERTTVSRTIYDSIVDQYESKMFDTYISKSVDAAKSSESGIPLCKTKSKLGTEFTKLAQEVLSRC